MINYTTVSSRIGKWKAEILTIAHYVQTLHVTGPMTKPFPRNNSKTAIFRRWLPFGGVDNRFMAAAATDAATAFANAHLLAEGVTPSADTITPTDIQVVMQQYGMLYAFTDQTYDFHEDDIPGAITQQLGERKGTLDEQIDYAALQACTSKLYAGGGSTRASVDNIIKLEGLRAIARVMYLNSSQTMFSAGQVGPNYGSAPTEAAWCVVSSTDSLIDFRNMSGWIPKENYAGGTRAIHPLEKGTVEEFKVIVSPHLMPILDAGVVTGSAPTLKANSTNVDVYQTVITAREAWGKLKMSSTKAVDPAIHMPKKKDKADPLGQRGYHGMSFYAASKVLNDGWMYIYEHGITASAGTY